MTRKGRILVAGAIGQHPIGGAGNAWAFVQYLLGLRRLGFDVVYVEHIAAEKCVGDDWSPSPFLDSANRRFFRAVMDRIGFGGRCSLLLQDSDESEGLSLTEVEELARGADLLLNMSGRFHLASVLDAVPRRAYLDMDPGFVQVWQEQYGVDMNLSRHDVHFTVGLNLGAADCPLPTCGIDWQPTLPPVVLSEWETTQPAGSRYTTVADWRGYGAVEWRGCWYGQKSDEFIKLLDLPRRSSAPLEICLAIHPDEEDRARLLAHGWQLSEPRQQAATLDTYRDYIRQSRGELTAVKHGYAAGNTGWFSDRSACYLAAGRPVVVQETGIHRFLPTGAGLLTFTNLDEASAALASVEADYPRHAAAAVDLAREHLDSDRVLTRMLERAGCL